MKDYFTPSQLCQLHASILPSLSTGNFCYVLYISNGKQLIIAFQKTSD